MVLPISGIMYTYNYNRNTNTNKRKNNNTKKDKEFKEVLKSIKDRTPVTDYFVQKV